MIFLYIILSAAIGAVLTAFLMQGKRKETETRLRLAQQQVEQQTAIKEDLVRRLQQTEQERNNAQTEATEQRMAYERVNTELQAEQRRHTSEAELQKKQFEQQLKTVQEQFSNLATQVLRQTADQLKSDNNESMGNITRPLRDNLKQLQEAIHNTNSETAKSTASLSEQLKAMSEQTQKIDQAATRLTNVIRGGNTEQGRWGERQLTEILDMQGFRIGEDYDVQQTITDAHGNAITNTDSGKTMRPDVILHYPNNEDVIIDAKMSIEAYYDYMATEDKNLRVKYADTLVRSIRNQATGLAQKDYSRYVQSPRHAIDFVIMFVPNDGALTLALNHDPRLWRDAFDRHVFITGQQNLMAILRMIQIAWRQYAQTESQKKVYSLADEMVKRVGEFIRRFDKVKKDIDALNKDYDDAYNKVYTGRQSIVQKANELKALGVKESANHPIPETQEDLRIDNEQQTNDNNETK